MSLPHHPDYLPMKAPTMTDLIERLEQAKRRAETGLPQTMEEILRLQLERAPMRLTPLKARQA